MNNKVPVESFTGKEKLPFTSVAVPVAVPAITTETPTNGSPFLSFTTPLIIVVVTSILFSEPFLAIIIVFSLIMYDKFVPSRHLSSTVANNSSLT